MIGIVMPLISLLTLAASLALFAGVCYALFLGIKIMRWYIQKNEIR